MKKFAKSGTEVRNIRFPYSVCSTVDRMEKTSSAWIDDQNQRYNYYCYYYNYHHYHYYYLSWLDNPSGLRPSP
jgi:hypothetical protein